MDRLAASLNNQQGIDVDTIASMNALEVKTLLSAGRATAILSAEVQETERP